VSEATIFKSCYLGLIKCVLRSAYLSKTPHKTAAIMNIVDL